MWGAGYMQTKDTAEQTSRHSAQAPRWVVVIGANTGGPQALAEVLPRFSANLGAAVVVMQQMRPGFTRVLAEQLSHICRLPISEPEDGQALQTSRIYVAPSASRLTFEKISDQPTPAYQILLEDAASSPELLRTRTDCAMESAASVFGARCVGILLTGLGVDGREGMRAISTAGGITIAQDEASSIVHDLPASAIEADIVSDTLPLWNISDRVREIVGGSANAVAA